MAKLGTKSRSYFFNPMRFQTLEQFLSKFKMESLNPPYKVCSGVKVSLELEDYFAFCNMHCCYRRSLLDCNKYVLIGKHISIALHLQAWTLGCSISVLIKTTHCSQERPS